MRKIVLTVLIAAGCVLGATSTSFAAPAPVSVKVKAKNIARLLVQFKKAYNRLSDTGKKKVLAYLDSQPGNFPDSDVDGLPDLLELPSGAGVCNHDTDGDGVDDGQEVEDGLKPDSPDSDNDGVTDNNELEVKGVITVREGEHMVVGGIDFVLNGGTVLHGVGLDGLIVGRCLEVKGHKDGELNIADDVKSETGCV